MKRCGECVHFIVSSANAAQDGGYCNAFLDEDGIGKEVTLYMTVEKCPEFKELDRIRTNVSEHMADNQFVRVARGFEEK